MQSLDRLKKSEIRKRILNTLNSKEPVEIRNKSDLILKNLISSEIWINADIIFTYLAVDKEVETGEIVKCAVISSKKVAVPRIVGKKLTFFLVSDHIRPPFNTDEIEENLCDIDSIYEILNTDRYDRDNDLPQNTIFNSSYRYLDPYHERHFEFNQFNILEPKIHLPVINFDNIKNYNILLIVPGIAFTKQKDRLGRGGGYYDRTINEFRLQKMKSFSAVGMFFEEQSVDNLPLDPWDQKLDFVVTEKQMY